jgi:hypothetical protein
MPDDDDAEDDDGDDDEDDDDEVELPLAVRLRFRIVVLAGRKRCFRRTSLLCCCWVSRDSSLFVPSPLSELFGRDPAELRLSAVCRPLRSNLDCFRRCRTQKSGLLGRFTSPSSSSRLSDTKSSEGLCVAVRIRSLLEDRGVRDDRPSFRKDLLRRTPDPSTDSLRWTDDLLADSAPDRWRDACVCGRGWEGLRLVRLLLRVLLGVTLLLPLLSIELPCASLAARRRGVMGDAEYSYALVAATMVFAVVAAEWECFALREPPGLSFVRPSEEELVGVFLTGPIPS